VGAPHRCGGDPQQRWRVGPTAAGTPSNPKKKRLGAPHSGRAAPEIARVLLRGGTARTRKRQCTNAEWQCTDAGWPGTNSEWAMHGSEATMQRSERAAHPTVTHCTLFESSRA
jgi:hypothetical protein